MKPVPLHLTDLVVGHPGSSRSAVVLSQAIIPAPGLTAIVGPSGCGKSTLLQALLGELTPDRGTITLAGEPRDLPAWRRLVAQVPQTPWLSADTIAANLRLGRPDADDALLWETLSEVGMWEAVAALPDALNTRLGEDGAGFSAGQRARLALARVLVADRPYVVLDEPSAHLDAETEQVILRTLILLAQHATVVVVAHRPAIIAAADHVITLDPPAHGTTRDVPVQAGSRPSSPAPAAAPSPRLRTRRQLALATCLATLAALSGIALTATAGWLIARAAEHPPVLMLMIAIIGVRTFGLARPAFGYAERLVSHDVALRLLAEVRAHVYDVLVPLAPARLGRRRGDLLASVVDDVDARMDQELRVRQPIAGALAVAVATTAFAFALAPPAALPIGLLTFGGGGVSLGLAWSAARRTERAFVNERAALSAEVVADLQAARQLVLWQADVAAVHRVGEIGARLAETTRATTRALATARGVLLVATGAAVAATAALVAPGLARGSLSAPMAALMVLVPLALHDVLATLPEAGAMAVRTHAARTRLAALEALTPAVLEPTEPEVLTGPTALHVEDADIGWGEQPVLTGLDFHLAPGDSVGVVGPSGCGKSTLAALLVRHLAPLAGDYRVGDRSAQALGSAEVRRHVGLVDDDPYVFASSLRENLRLAAPGANDTALIEALVSADLAAWFDALPHGLDTALGEGATGVSGGERARLEIARALLADPDVLVLDEPTAHLDHATAHSVSATLLAARAERGVVWISHDEVGLAELDAVLDLSRGTRPGSRGSRSPVLR